MSLWPILSILESLPCVLVQNERFERAIQRGGRSADRGNAPDDSVSPIFQRGMERTSGPRTSRGLGRTRSTFKPVRDASILMIIYFKER